MNITILARNESLAATVRTLIEGADDRLAGVAAGTAHLQWASCSLSQWLIDHDGLMRAPLRALGAADGVASSDQALPDILILDGTDPGTGAISDVERLTVRLPQLPVFLIVEDGGPAQLLAAMRAGVREILALPLDAANLLAALARAQARAAQRAAPPRNGRIYGFTACKGGSGATFVAANIAYALAADHAKRVLLIDLDLQYGDASFYFMSGEAAAGSVASVMRDAAHLDEALLASSSMRILPNLHVLHAPEEAEEIAAVTPALTGRLLDAAAAHYDCVLFDVNRSFDAVALAALDRADAIFAIMQSMVPDMRDARTMLRAFRQLGYPDSKLRFVVNRSDKKEDAPLRPIERGLGVDFYRTIPNDYLNASASVNQGVSIIKHAPASPVSRVLSEIAADLTGTAGGQKTWLHKWLRRA